MVGQTIIDAYSAPNSRYADVDLEDHKQFRNSLNSGSVQVVNIQTKGKFMYWSFTNDWYMFSTFGMTGQWSPFKGKHPCFIFHHYSRQDEIGSHKQMIFNDPRHFGTIKFTNNFDVLTKKLNSLGWDPLGSQANLKWLNYKISNSDKPIAQLLMDQSLFCGVGNYIKSESLYVSQISPWRKGSSLTDHELKTLYNAIVSVMESSYQHQGATISTYKTVYGEEGRYSTLFKVYGKKLDPGGNKIVSETTPDKRTTHWVPSIQK